MEQANPFVYGSIKMERLKELWFHMGTKCNLSCPDCLEGSSPTATRLMAPSLADIKPRVLKGIKLGVTQCSFTGGEPFLVKEMVPILDWVLDYRPCLVLTNGTTPLIVKMGVLPNLLKKKNALSFRISIDAPTSEIHDLARGKGSFEMAMSSLSQLHNMGFHVSIARHAAVDENVEEIDNLFKELFKKWSLPESLHIVAFPQLFSPFSHPGTPQISPGCLTTYHTKESLASFMCAYSRMVIKKDNQMRAYACTLVDDDTSFDCGGDLEESMNRSVQLTHHRCFSCFSQGTSCSEV